MPFDSELADESRLVNSDVTPASIRLAEAMSKMWGRHLYLLPGTHSHRQCQRRLDNDCCIGLVTSLPTFAVMIGYVA